MYTIIKNVCFFESFQSFFSSQGEKAGMYLKTNQIIKHKIWQDVMASTMLTERANVSLVNEVIIYLFFTNLIVFI